MEQKVKERVVGAAVLMAVAVIFIPMVLSGPADDVPSRGDDAAARSAPHAPRESRSGFSSRIVPLGESGGDAGEARSSAPVPETPLAAPAPVSPSQTRPAASKPRAVTESQPRKPAPPRAEEPPGGGAGWVVQLGSFANLRNAHALRDRLKAKGYSAFAVSSGTGKDAVTRVYVGPEATRDRAESHVSRLLTETRLKGIVVRNPAR